MANRVLILDDDTDFISLLTDIFEQADYDVNPVEDPLEAIDVFRDNQFDLVVTDHKMPRMTGAEYMKVIKEINPDVPVIMVSGYLENDTIRELISDGVGGVFLKPLNIFSLLERTAELIEEAKKYSKESSGLMASLAEAEGSRSNLRFNFHSFPCKASRSIRFAERLYSLRNFKSTMSLVGQPGANYQAICNDIRGFDSSIPESFVYLTADNFDEAFAITHILKAQEAEASTVTCVLVGIESMSDIQKKLAVELAKTQGVFDNGDLQIRVIFCVSGDLDSLFDDGLIDENLYILMGTTEVEVPSLKECSHDVPLIAQRMLHVAAEKTGVDLIPRLEKSAAELLLHFSFDGDQAQLSSAITSIIESDPPEILTAQIFERALAQASSVPPQARMNEFLKEQMQEYASAALTLFNGDMGKTTALLGENAGRLIRGIK